MLSAEYHSSDIARILTDRAILARLSEDNGPMRLQFEHTRGEGSYTVSTNLVGRGTCEGRPVQLSIPICTLIESEIGKKPLATTGVIELASTYFSENLGETLYIAIYQLVSESLMDALGERPDRKFGEFGRHLTKLRQEIRRGTPGFFAKGIDVGDMIRKIVAGFGGTSQRPTKRRLIRELASHSKWRGPTGNELEIWLKSEAAIKFLDFHLKKSFDCNWQSFLDTHQTTAKKRGLTNPDVSLPQSAGILRRPER